MGEICLTTRTMSRKQSFTEKCYKDKNGYVVLGQTPNIPIIIWFLSTVLAKLFSNGKSHDLFTAIAVGSLFTWALLELLQGVNYLRRALGAVVLIFILVSKLK